MMPINSLCALYPSCLQNVSFFMFLLFYVLILSKLHFCFVLSSSSCFLVLLGLCLHHEMTDLGMR